MSQHFLLSAKARTLSLALVARMTDEEARETFQRIRWADNGGEPFCPKCACTALYIYKTRNLWKCKGCDHQFSVTSGTIFASRKMPVRDILLAIAIFTNGAKGHSALQLSRDLNCQYKSAYVLAHKIREALGAGDKGATVSGEVELDGCYVGGYVKPANFKENRRDRRLASNQTGKRRVVIVSKTEYTSVASVASRIAPGSIVHADEASHWDILHSRFDTKRINHTLAYSDGQSCTNMAESFFSRLRRAEAGIHHRISGQYLAAYAAEMDWREDNRRVSNGAQFNMMIAATMAHPVSRNWKGYWKRA
jgi:transposase-like protein